MTDLHRLIARELDQLSPPRAPQTLLPRVMAAVHAWALRPWYQRAWFTWPLGWQMTGIGAMVLFAAGTALLLSTTQAVVAGATAGILSEVADTAQRVASTTAAARIVSRILFEPVLSYRVYAFALALLMAAACTVGAAALNRVALGRTLQS